MDGPVPRGDSELSRVLGSAFRTPRRKRGAGRDMLDAALEGYSVNTEGLVPGIMYGGGRQTQRGGMRGTDAQGIMDDLSPPPTTCPPWLLSPECRNIMSRMLEETFRNFQQHVSLPSHVNAPFDARCIDDFPTALVTIPGGSYAAGAFVSVATVSVPAGRFRATITHMGQSAESAAAFSDLEWRITIDGVPFVPYNQIRIQIGTITDPTEVCLPPLLGNQIVTLEAASLSVAAHTVLGRLRGWSYPVRQEGGVSVKSTFTD